MGRLKSRQKVASAGGKNVRFYAIKLDILEADISGDEKDVVSPSVSPKVAPTDDDTPKADTKNMHPLISGHKRETPFFCSTYIV